MRAGGLDIGSRFIKYVVVEDSIIRESYREDTGTEPLATCLRYIKDTHPERLIATGYGRHLLEVHGDFAAITEIKAVALGARQVFPGCRTIIDIGGQDTKVVSLNDHGTVEGFEMNDRCAAGTGKFLEIMAHTLGYALDRFGDSCRDGDPGKPIKINSMCTVFAESEVISLIARGIDKASIVYALHNSIIDRILPLVRRIGVKKEVVFAGGCARNACLASLLMERLSSTVLIAENPDFLAALGAALHASQLSR
jgi:(R)-2-hydroxyacyl-CoA dehydratese activating ATPase